MWVYELYYIEDGYDDGDVNIGGYYDDVYYDVCDDDDDDVNEDGSDKSGNGNHNAYNEDDSFDNYVFGGDD